MTLLHPFRKRPLSRQLALAGMVLLTLLLAVVSTQALVQWRWFLVLLGLAILGLNALPARAIVTSTHIPANDEDEDDLSVDVAAGLPDLLWQIDYASRTITPLNDHSTGLHPFPEADDNKLASLFPARVSRLYLEALIELQSNNAARTLEYHLGGADAPQNHYEARLVPLDEKSCLAVIREINHIKETEEALLNQQIFLQQIFDTSPCLIFLRDRHGRFLLVNRETQATFGHELLVQSHLELPSDESPLTAGDEEALARGEPVRLMDFWIDANGQRHWFDMTKLPLVRGNETYILTSAIDISHIKSAELALMDNSNLIRAVANVLPSAFLLIAGETIQFANAAACDLLACTATDLIGLPAAQFANNWEALHLSGSGTLEIAGKQSTLINCSIMPLSENDPHLRLLMLG